MSEYHKVFDVYRTQFLTGEMVWNFADFMTDQGKGLGVLYVSVCVCMRACAQCVCLCVCV